jgi:hypothetical protein
MVMESIAKVEFWIKGRSSRVANGRDDGFLSCARQTPGLAPEGPVVRGKLLSPIEMPLGFGRIVVANQVDTKFKAGHGFHVAERSRWPALLEGGFGSQELTR